jgi:hypothetical protein
MSAHVWYLVTHPTGDMKLVSAVSPEAAVEAAATAGEFVGDVAVYVVDYIGRFDARVKLTVTRLTNPMTERNVPPPITKPDSPRALRHEQAQAPEAPGS